MGENLRMAKKDKGTKRRRRYTLPALPVRHPERRAPSGRKLTPQERASLRTVTEIYQHAERAAGSLSRKAKSDDVRWFVAQFMNPAAMALGKEHKLPSWDLLHRAVLYLENAATGESRTELRPKLAAALDDWIDAMVKARRSKRWKDVAGHPATLEQFRNWRDRLDLLEPVAIPELETPPEFESALARVREWDQLMWEVGHGAGGFSLREEIVRLHNWPGDQWDSGDDFARAQRRFKKRLKAARKAHGPDPVRDRVLRRSLYLREGLLLNPVDDLSWLLAVLKLRWAMPDVLDPRPENRWWRFVDRVQGLVREPVRDSWGRKPFWMDASSPLEVPPDKLEAVSGPGVMIDVDEDVVAALPPGCRVWRLVMSARGPLGPDWIIYWIESELGDAHTFPDLVETAKLHPAVVLVADARPSELAALVKPFLGGAFEIPTHSLAAYNHIAGASVRVAELTGAFSRPDAGLS